MHVFCTAMTVVAEINDIAVQCDAPSVSRQALQKFLMHEKYDNEEN